MGQTVLNMSVCAKYAGWTIVSGKKKKAFQSWVSRKKYLLIQAIFFFSHRSTRLIRDTSVFSVSVCITVKSSCNSQKSNSELQCYSDMRNTRTHRSAVYTICMLGPEWTVHMRASVLCVVSQGPCRSKYMSRIVPISSETNTNLSLILTVKLAKIMKFF